MGDEESGTLYGAAIALTPPKRLARLTAQSTGRGRRLLNALQETDGFCWNEPGWNGIAESINTILQKVGGQGSLVILSSHPSNEIRFMSSCISNCLQSQSAAIWLMRSAI